MENLAQLYKAHRDKFNALLRQPRLPEWMRIKCDAVLANITSDADETEKYLRDARRGLESFKEGRPSPDPMQANIDGIAAHLDEVEQGIEERRENPWEEDGGDEDAENLSSEGQKSTSDEDTKSSA
ncbi:hypothetical protein Slin14017_G021620 [Septoria linicola]|nr:hypothetical protein Slin14017_G021620 [Septoria linicola]